MPTGWTQPQPVIQAGVILLIAGYVALDRIRPEPVLARIVFYLGLLLLVVGVIRWLRLPPAPDPADKADDVADAVDD
jgi:hypothetical protein